MTRSNETIDRAIALACKDQKQCERVREEIRSYMELFHSFGWIKTKEETHEAQVAFIKNALEKINQRRELIRLVVADPDVCLFLEKHMDFFNCDSDALCRLFHEAIQDFTKDEIYEGPDDLMVQLVCKVFDGEIVEMFNMPYKVVIQEGNWNPVDIVDIGFVDRDTVTVSLIDQWKNAETLVL